MPVQCTYVGVHEYYHELDNGYKLDTGHYLYR